MKPVDELIYEAIKADESLMTIIGGHVVSTCFEIPPDFEDNTPLPNIIISDDGFQEEIFTKDDVWDADNERVQVTVDIGAQSPESVKQLTKMVRKAVKDSIHAMYESDEEIPSLISCMSEGIQWDWMKPCYYTKLIYTCDVAVDLSDDATENVNENEQEGQG